MAFFRGNQPDDEPLVPPYVLENCFYDFSDLKRSQVLQFVTDMNVAILRGIEANNGPAPEANLQPIPTYPRSLSFWEYHRARMQGYLEEPHRMMDCFDDHYAPVREMLDRDRYEAALRLQNLPESTFLRSMWSYDYAYRIDPTVIDDAVFNQPANWSNMRADAGQGMEGLGPDVGIRAPEDESLIQPILEVYLIDYRNGFDALPSRNYHWRESAWNPNLIDDATATLTEMHLDAEARDSGYLEEEEELAVNELFIDRQPAVDPHDFDAGAEIAAWFDEGFDVVNGPSRDLNDVRRDQRREQRERDSSDESDRRYKYRRD